MFYVHIFEVLESASALSGLFRCIKTLQIDDSFTHPEESYNREEFKFVIQTLKSLVTFEIKGSQVELYLNVMINDMQSGDLK
jgi:hypothetical protein